MSNTARPGSGIGAELIGVRDLDANYFQRHTEGLARDLPQNGMRARSRIGDCRRQQNLSGILNLQLCVRIADADVAVADADSSPNIRSPFRRAFAKENRVNPVLTSRRKK
jgi:hypothetical protein